MCGFRSLEGLGRCRRVLRWPFAADDAVAVAYSGL